MPADAPELRIGVIGAGWAGREHCRSIAAIGGARVCAVVDVDSERAAALAGDVGAATHPDVETLLASETLDAVVVGTPPGHHADPVIAALTAGIAAFVEKPIARTAADAQAIVDTAQRTGGVCAVGYQWRALDLLPALQAELHGRSAALLVSQGVGPTQARGWFDDRRQSGRLVSERASHHMDLQRAVAGEVVSVHAVRGGVVLSGWTTDPDAVEDVVSLTLEFASGAVGAIHVGWTPVGDPGRQALSVYATGARFDLALDPDFTLDGDANGRLVRMESAEAPFQRQMRSFLAAVRTRDPAGVACGALEGAGSLAVALAAEEALERDGAVAVERVAPTRPPGSAHRADMETR